MKKFAHRALVVLRNPALKPVEIWALRTVFAIVAVKLGIDLKGTV